MDMHPWQARLRTNFWAFSASTHTGSQPSAISMQRLKGGNWEGGGVAEKAKQKPTCTDWGQRRVLWENRNKHDWKT